MKASIYILSLLHITITSSSLVLTIAWRSLIFPTHFVSKRQNEKSSKMTFNLLLTSSTLRGGSGDNENFSSNKLISSEELPVTPHIQEPEIWAEKKRALICMDIFSEFHGLYLALRAKTVYGAAVVVVFSDYMKGYFQRVQPEEFETGSTISTMCMPTKEQKDAWCEPLKEFELVGIVCESDSGLADAERLGDILEINCHNGINEARRNKFLMIEAVRKAGLPAVKQRLCRNIDEALSFAQEMGIGTESNNNDSLDRNRRVVVKPKRGVASDDVFLCCDVASVEYAFHRILGSEIFSTPWEQHDSVLVQECAVGQEFAIDIVSKNGEHKVAAIWKYDKRPANGASFVYFSTNVYDGELSPIISEYAKKCLDALGFKWGITHNEVIITQDGPRLVEVNCRQHNMDFLPLTMGTIGYNALDMLLCAYLGGEGSSFYPPGTDNQRLEWEMLPDIPSKRMHGCMVHLVNYKRGKLVSVNEDALMEIQQMDSVLDLEVYESFLEIGNEITPTIDIRSDVGWVQMLNPNEDEFERDYERILQLMPVLFEVE